MSSCSLNHSMTFLQTWQNELWRSMKMRYGDQEALWLRPWCDVCSTKFTFFIKYTKFSTTIGNLTFICQCIQNTQQIRHFVVNLQAYIACIGDNVHFSYFSQLALGGLTLQPENLYKSFSSQCFKIHPTTTRLHYAMVDYISQYKQNMRKT